MGSAFFPSRVPFRFAAIAADSNRDTKMLLEHDQCHLDSKIIRLAVRPAEAKNTRLTVEIRLDWSDIEGFVVVGIFAGRLIKCDLEKTRVFDAGQMRS
jgi:hypothetical protein